MHGEAREVVVASTNTAHELAEGLEHDFAQARGSLVTLADWVRFGASLFAKHGLFFGHGTDNAVDEAILLVLHALHLDPGLAPELWQSATLPSERDDLCRLFEARVRERRPAAYLVGRAWFAGLPIAVDERVLIPRSPIAELIEERFEPWLAGVEPARILDLCTGSGCIAIASALAFPNAEVVAADVCAGALEVARLNVARFGLEGRVELVLSDLLTEVDGQFDLILCNPPYVPDAEMATLPQEYLHEPALGLAAGVNGLLCVDEILTAAPRHMRDGAILVLEVGSARPFFDQAHGGLEVFWPEFERGGGDVAIISRSALVV